ncbi:unnamed protein product [Arctogadus glacialis]
MQAWGRDGDLPPTGSSYPKSYPKLAADGETTAKGIGFTFCSLSQEVQTPSHPPPIHQPVHHPYTNPSTTPTPSRPPPLHQAVHHPYTNPSTTPTPSRPPPLHQAVHHPYSNPSTTPTPTRPPPLHQPVHHPYSNPSTTPTPTRPPPLHQPIHQPTNRPLRATWETAGETDGRSSGRRENLCRDGGKHYKRFGVKCVHAKRSERKINHGSPSSEEPTKTYA